MNTLGMATRSALVRHAEHGLSRMERRARRRREIAAVAALCVMVIGAYLLAEFVAQVLVAVL